MKVINLKDSLVSYDGIGDFEALKERLEMLEKMLEDYISQNRKRNLEVKTTLIEEAKSYAANPDWRDATEQLKELRQRWIRVGAVEDDQKETVENTFQEIYDNFYEKKKAFHEAKKEMMAAREKQYEALIEKAKKLKSDIKDNEELDKSYNALVEEWKELENIPKEKYSELLKEFKKFTQAIKPRKSVQGKTSESKSKGGSDKEKQALIEELKNAKSLPTEKAVEKAKAIQQKWKNTGKAFEKSLNEQFFTLNDYIFEKHFLESLYNKKVKKGIEEKEGVKFKMNLLRDLIPRDQRELNIFEENLGKFNLGTQKLDKMVGFKPSNIINNGETKTISGIEITAIPMYNITEGRLEMHVKGRGNGYVLEKNGYRVYISGDTEDIPEMRALKNIDKAFLCMNLPYTMDINQAANAVLEFQPKQVIPYHYRGTEGFQDVEKFKQMVEGANSDIKVTLMDWYPAQAE
jgi:chemotaxis protein histidine kinase CheA